MRVFRLCLLGLLVYVVSVFVLFPAAPVIDRIKPQLAPLTLTGVSGRLYNGVISDVKYMDDLLPLEFTRLTWQVAPKILLTGGAGANVSFEGYGGGGRGQVARQWNGDIAISNFAFNADAKALEPLLPVPIASFRGRLTGEIESLRLEHQLLVGMEAEFSWKDAVLETPVLTSLGDIDLTISRDGPESHLATLVSSGGDIAIDGKITMAQSGDFSANVLFTPSANAPAGVIDGLRQFARPEAGGRFRFQRNGNVNKLM